MLKLGYLPLVKGSWLNEKQVNTKNESVKQLKQLATVIETGKLIVSETDADEACALFAKENIDVLVVHHLAFPLGAITPSLARRLGVPVILWSTPEAPFRTPAFRLEANSFCASNMTANHLWRMKHPYAFVYGEPDKAIKEMKSELKVFEAIKQFNGFRVGSVGNRVPGFFTSTFNEMLLREKFGVEVEGITMLELVDLAKSLKGTDQPEAKAAVLDLCTQGDISDEELELAVNLYAAFNILRKKYRIDAWAVRCWPEFSDLYGIGVCHLLGVLTGHECPAACEGDVYGAVAMQLGEIFSGEKTFFADLVIFDEKDDTGIFWHCGAAPACLCKPGSKPCIRKHPVIDGGGKKGVAVEFPLKPGHVTVCRIGENLEGNLRLMVFSAEGIETEQCIRSTPLKVKFERPVRGLIDDLIYNGFEHHYVVCYGDVKKQLKEFARLTNLELIEF
jgi:L-fucose isomerase-like protein